MNQNKKEFKKVKEFRYHDVEVKTKRVKRVIKHPTYVFYKHDGIYIYVSLTHSNKVENLILIKLKKNPNPKDNRDSYFVDEIKEDVKEMFGKRKTGWVMDSYDDEMIREEFRKIKKDDFTDRTKGWLIGAGDELHLNHLSILNQRLVL